MEYEDYTPPVARSESEKRLASKLYNSIKKKTLSRKYEGTPKDCTRFNPNYKDIGCRNAICYLKLRDLGCQKKSALVFNSKAVCRTDVTRELDGPHNFRRLKPCRRKNPLNINVIPSLTPQGWSFQDPYYELGKKHLQSHKMILEKGYRRNPKLVKKLLDNENKQRNKFMDKVVALKMYYKEYLDKTTMRGLPPGELYEKVKKFREELKSAQQSHREQEEAQKLQLTKEESRKQAETERQLEEAYYRQLKNDREKLRVYENLAEYTDYIYKLTLDDSEFERYSLTNQKVHRGRMKVALELLKKSNDIAGNFSKKKRKRKDFSRGIDYSSLFSNKTPLTSKESRFPHPSLSEDRTSSQ